MYTAGYWKYLEAVEHRLLKVGSIIIESRTTNKMKLLDGKRGNAVEYRFIFFFFFFLWWDDDDGEGMRVEETLLGKIPAGSTYEN